MGVNFGHAFGQMRDQTPQGVFVSWRRSRRARTLDQARRGRPTLDARPEGAPKAASAEAATLRRAPSIRARTP